MFRETLLFWRVLMDIELMDILYQQSLHCLKFGWKLGVAGSPKVLYAVYFFFPLIILTLEFDQFNHVSFYFFISISNNYLLGFLIQSLLLFIFFISNIPIISLNRPIPILLLFFYYQYSNNYLLEVDQFQSLLLLSFYNITSISR